MTINQVLMLPFMISSVILLLFTVSSIFLVIHSIITGSQTVLKRFGDIFQIFSTAWMANLYSALFIFFAFIGLEVFGEYVPQIAVGYVYGAANVLCAWYLIWVVDYNVNVRPIWKK